VWFGHEIFGENGDWENDTLNATGCKNSTEPEQEKETVEVDDEGEEDSFLRRRQRK